MQNIVVKDFGLVLKTVLLFLYRAGRAPQAPYFFVPKSKQKAFPNSPNIGKAPLRTNDSGRECKAVTGTKAQDKAMQELIDKAVKNKNEAYNLTQRSCVDFVRDTLRKVHGIQNLSNSNFPETLYNSINNRIRGYIK